MLAIHNTSHEYDLITKLYEQHKNVLYYHALKYTKNHHTAEDAVHNAYVEIIKRQHEYAHKSHDEFRKITMTITKNKALDLMRKQNKISDTPFEDLEVHLVTEDAPVDEQMIKADDLAALRKHLHSIDETSRQILIMKYVHKMSSKEIGTHIGIKAEHVDTKIMRAKQKLRKMFEEEKGEENK